MSYKNIRHKYMLNQKRLALSKDRTNAYKNYNFS